MSWLNVPRRCRRCRRPQRDDHSCPWQRFLFRVSARLGGGMARLLTDDVDDVHTLKDLAEDNVPAVQPAGHDGGNEL